MRDIPIFVGGPHAIVCPSSLEEAPDIDGFCIGEGEYTFLEIVDKISQREGLRNHENENFLFSYFGEGSSILNIPGLSKRDIKDLFFRFDLEIYNKSNFLWAYIAKRIKYALFSTYNLLPSFLKNIIRSTCCNIRLKN